MIRKNGQSRRAPSSFGICLLMVTCLPALPLPAVGAKSVIPNRPSLLAQASVQSSSPYPEEVQQWQRQVESLQQQGKYLEAAQIQEKELAWTEQHLGPDHPSTAAILNTLAEVYRSQGAYVLCLTT